MGEILESWQRRRSRPAWRRRMSPESPVSIGKRIPGRQALPWHHERPRQVSPTCFIRACHMCHDQFMSATTLSRVPWLIHVYHDSFMYAMTHSSVSWLIQVCHYSFVCAMTYSCEPWLILACHWLFKRAMNPSCVPSLTRMCHDLFTCAMTHYIYIYTCIHICIYIHTCIHICLHIYIYICIYIYIYTHSYAYTYTYTSNAHFSACWVSIQSMQVSIQSIHMVCGTYKTPKKRKKKEGVLMGQPTGQLALRGGGSKRRGKHTGGRGFCMFFF